MERNKSIHDLMTEKVGIFAANIERGNSLNGYKLVSIKSEERILEIISCYNDDVSDLPERTVKKLIATLENCRKISFWHSNLLFEIEKTIRNLKNSLK